MSSPNPDDRMISPSHSPTREDGNFGWEGPPASPPYPSLGTLPLYYPDGTLLLGGVMKEEPHYEAYEVMDRSGRPRADFVARVYQLGPQTAVAPKLRRHRLRCINRLAARTVLEVKAPGLRIIVCRVGVDSAGAYPGGARSVPDVSGSVSPEGAFLGVPSLSSMSEPAPSNAKESEGDMESTGGPGLEAGVVETATEAEKDPEPGIPRGGSDAHRKERTPSQRETKRVRQRKRRQEARRAKRHSPECETGPLDDDWLDRLDSADDPDSAHDSDTNGLEDEDGIMLLLMSLATAYDLDAKQFVYADIPVGLDIAQLLQNMCKNPPLDYLWRFLNPRTLALDTAADLQGFLAIQRSEILFLKREQRKMRRIEQHYSNQFGRAESASSSQQWMWSTPLTIRKFIPDTAQDVRSMLPRMIADAAEAYRDIRLRWDEMRQLEEREQAQSTLGASKSTVAPWLATYWELEKAWKTRMGV